MKAPLFPILLIACLASVETAWADIVVKEFVEPVSGAVTSGYVFQGSRGMKRLGKGNRKTEAVVGFTGPVNVIPVEASESKKDPSVSSANGPLPRFGFGSDYSPGMDEPLAKADMTSVIPELVPVYQAVTWMRYAPSVRYIPWYSGYSGCTYRFGYPIVFGGRSTLHFSHGPIFGYPVCR